MVRLGSDIAINIARGSQQLQHFPAVEADIDAGSNFAELTCLLKEGDGDIGESGERDGGS